MLFLASDTHLITTGSRDFCILQWSVLGKLPVVNEEEEEYDTENDMNQASRHHKDNHSDNESYHSDYSADDQEDDEDYEYSKNAARGKQARGQQRPSDNSHYSDAADSSPRDAPQGHGRPLRKNHLNQPTGDDSRSVGRSPRYNVQAQNTRSQQGSYAEKFNKQKAVGNARRNPPQQEPADMGHYSDEESPRQRPGHAGRGGGRSRHPARGQDREWDRRQMR